MIDARQRQRAENAIESLKQRDLLGSAKTLEDLLTVIDAHKCQNKPMCCRQGCTNDATREVLMRAHFYLPLCEGCQDEFLQAPLGKPVGGVPDELTKDALGWIQAKEKSIAQGENIMEELLTIADAQPGWVDGPPKEQEEGWVIVHPDGRVEVDYFHIREFHSKSGAAVTQERWRQRFRPDCHMVRGQITFPPPPKREPVVDCCEKGKERYERRVDKPGWALDTGGIYMFGVTHCQWCGVPLPELEK